MWLLSTARAELEFFADPESVEPGYAILSHVWDDKEDTFQDLQILRNRCTETGTNPRDFVSEKIRRSCMLAAAHGLKWVWVDTCCIDKKSSAELSEAINSMFRYYARSRVCYVYLRDVPSVPSSDFEDRNSAFCRSQWHRRGWTLQELIAPKFLIFVSSQWDVLGTKAELAVEVEQATGVPVEILRFQRELADVSVGERMSWASQRKTTRIEDEGYCLMGIFGINMPTLYGEGRRAFYRLQEEIMKITIDVSLFAWEATGRIDRMYVDGQSHACLLPSVLKTPDHSASDQVSCRPEDTACLLAPSPGFHLGPNWPSFSLCANEDTPVTT